MSEPVSTTKRPRFSLGEVVYDEQRPGVLGLVFWVGERSIGVAFEDGSRSAGPGLRFVIRHRKPRAVANVPPVTSYEHPRQSCWNRSQAVRAAIRRATTHHTSPNPSRTSPAG